MHNGHNPGTSEDLRYFNISQEAKEWIRGRAKDRMKPSQIVSMFHQRINQIYNSEALESLPLIQKRDLYISYIDVYNIVNEEIKGIIFLGNQKEGYSEDVSIKEWIISSKDDESYTCDNPSWGSSLGFMYGFQTEFQRRILKSKSAQIVCIDGTHGTTSHKTNLFTLLVRDNDGGQGVPIAHLISEKKAKNTLVYWLEAIKEQNKEWQSHTFLTDCDYAQQSAINVVYPEATILLCQWHVKNAWQKNKNKINGDSKYFKPQEKNENGGNVFKWSERQVTQKAALNELGGIMRIRDVSQARSKLDEYLTQWLEFNETKWVEYIRKEYQNNCEKWIDAYRLYEHQEMNTTNFIEAWHKKLKYTYLGAKQNHHIDTLIWTLRNALKDNEFECEAIQLMIGRMKPRQKEQRQRELAGLNFDIFKFPGGRQYSVKSSKDSQYEVSINDYVQQQSNNIKPAHFECTCVDFKYRGMACKHIFAVYQRYYAASIPHNAFDKIVKEPHDASDEIVKEPEEVHDVTFNDWVEAVKKVWDRHPQED